MIVGTAGHIDHGKTTLVKALTGVDTDRLPEEQRRGISIELGYAFLDVPPEYESPGARPPEAGAQPPRGAGTAGDRGHQRIGFVDVPGHERLVHTMISGATGIDLALLLVAADDGPMPQTQEHLAVLSLLGLQRGAVVVTKSDRVEPARLAAVQDEARALVAGTPLERAPVFAVSAQTGAGLEALREHLFEAARSGRRASDGERAFRLAVDRAFTLAGVGTVVTGSVHAGAVNVGDELVLVPGERRVRVRSLHAQNRAVQRAEAGQRCAVALAGLSKDEVARGQWLVAPLAALATDRLDAAITLWHAEARALRSGTPVQVHVGADVVPGSVALLDADLLAPGASGRVQLVLQRPFGAWRGDRVVLRDASASRTLAGGMVLDPFAPRRYRRTPQRLAELDACALPEAAARLAALVAASPQGLDRRRLAAAEGCAIAAEPPGALHAQDAQHDLLLGAAHADAARSALLQALAAFHARAPEEIGPDAARLRRLALPRLAEPLWRALLDELRAAGRIAVRGAFVHLPEHGVRLSAGEQRIAQKVAPRLAAAGFEGAWARDLARDAGESEALMRTTLARLAQQGELHQVVKDLYYPLPTIAALAAIARRVAAQDDAQQVTAAGFRDATGLGRKRAIQVLEYFDRVGLLRRVGDVHKLRGDASGLFAAEAALA